MKSLKQNRATLAILLTLFNIGVITTGLYQSEKWYFGFILLLDLIFMVGSDEIINKNGRVLMGVFALLNVLLLMAH